MKLKFDEQTFQTDAVNAVMKVFDGQPLAKSDFSLAQQNASVDYAADGTIGNALQLSDEQILSNVQQVQAMSGVAVSDALVGSTSEKGDVRFCRLNFTLEMETGTGKTYTFIKTMYELNKVYGFKKFVVVVPSVAIREGTMKNIAVTNAHFQAAYRNEPCVAMLYDSGKLNELRSFAQSDALSILVMSIDSFTKDSNKINQKGERAFAPIEFLKAVSPIVIVDEPQLLGTAIRLQAIAELNPLCTLGYSATHKNPYNLLYSLNPVQAYDLGLVKQIEVDGVQADGNHNEAFVELLAIKPAAKNIVAKVRIHADGATGVVVKDVLIKPGDNLLKKSNGRAMYADGFVLNEIREDEVEFSGGRVLRVGQVQGALADDVMRFQIERTVQAHFVKLKNLKPQGIKVLSLFFIDKVANYRAFDEDGNATLGKFGVWFEEAFNKYAAKYPDVIMHNAADVHNGYFSGDKKGKGAAAKTVWVDTKGDVAKDNDTYALIMKDKERLLSMNEPLQFIFSHSALSVGWDNPNVFQICTLNETRSAMKKRQEIGRGLRLCVNQSGERVHDKKVNVLTVVPNESYEVFAKTLQQEIEDDTGVQFVGRIKDRGARARVTRKALNPEEQALFAELWSKINYQTRYSVELNTSDLIKQCAAALADVNQYPTVRAPKIRANKAKIVMNQEGVHGVETGVDASDTHAFPASIPDVYAYIQQRVHLSRSTIYAVLEKSGRLAELLINPQAFLDAAVSAMKQQLQTMMVAGIQYHVVNDKYNMSVFDGETDPCYLSSLYPQGYGGVNVKLIKTIYQAQTLVGDEPIGDTFDCVLSDSAPENQFARDCAIDMMKLFFKLPSKFKIPTPLGVYNPDWALVFENDKRVHFVVETKSLLLDAHLRLGELLKIKCGEKHFGLGNDVAYKKACDLESVVSTNKDLT